MSNFTPTIFHDRCNYLSMLGLKLIRVNKRGPRSTVLCFLGEHHCRHIILFHWKSGVVKVPTWPKTDTQQVVIQQVVVMPILSSPLYHDDDKFGIMTTCGLSVTNFPCVLHFSKEDQCRRTCICVVNNNLTISNLAGEIRCVVTQQTPRRYITLVNITMTIVLLSHL